MNLNPNPAADAAFLELRKAQAAHPRFLAERAVILRTVADATQPRDVSRRACFDADYGAYTGHPMDPRNDDAHDETLSPEDAESEAAEHVLGHSESVADWLAKACDTPAGRESIDVRALDAVQIMEGSAPLLLAVLMNGDNTQALRALHRLRDLAAAQFKREIDERAAELLREVA